MDLTGSQVLVSSAGVSPREPRGSQLKFFVSGVLLLTVRSPGSVDFRILSGWRGDMVSQQVWSKRCRSTHSLTRRALKQLLCHIASVAGNTVRM